MSTFAQFSLAASASSLFLRTIISCISISSLVLSHRALRTSPFITHKDHSSLLFFLFFFSPLLIFPQSMSHNPACVRLVCLFKYKLCGPTPIRMERNRRDCSEVEEGVWSLCNRCPVLITHTFLLSHIHRTQSRLPWK